MRTIVWWRRVGVKAIGLTMLAGCSSRTPGLPYPPVGAAQRTSVLDAGAKLRVVFNSPGGCEAIFKGAALRFRSFPEDLWLADCARFQSDLGPWLSFDRQSMDRCGIREVVICVIADGTFAKGNRVLSLTWFLDAGRAQFQSMSWLEGTERISFPPVPDLHRYLHPYQDTPHQDTPPIPGRNDPEKS